MKIAFFEVREGEEEVLKAALPQDELFFSKDILTEESIPQVAASEVLSIHSNSHISKEIIEKFSNLKLIATRTTGFDHIDLKAAAEKNILICNVPSYGEITVAEFAFALLLTISRKTYIAVEGVKDTKRFDYSLLQGFDLSGKTLGVLGTGKIGAHVMQIAKGFGMNILGFDAFPNNELAQKIGFEYKSLEEVLSASDVITLHVPALDSTKHLINSANISKIKKGAVLINTARGAVIDTKALVMALENGILSSVGLDVLEAEEYFEKENIELTEEEKEIVELNKKLIEMKNVYITPHTAFNTKEAEGRIIQTSIENIQAFEQGQPKNLVKTS